MGTGELHEAEGRLEPGAGPQALLCWGEQVLYRKGERAWMEGGGKGTAPGRVGNKHNLP